MKKKAIKEALKNNGVKGYSRAIISGNWVTTQNYTGKIDERGMLYLKPIDKTDMVSRHYVIQF